MTGAVYAGIVTVGVASVMPHPHGLEPGTGWYGFFVAVPVFAIALILARPDSAQSLPRRAAADVAWRSSRSSTSAGCSATSDFSRTRSTPTAIFVYVIFATEVNDVAAFTFGRLFGRHPLRSEISPKKTWEGALGALAVAMVLPWLLRFSLPEFGPRQLDSRRA